MRLPRPVASAASHVSRLTPFSPSNSCSDFDRRPSAASRERRNSEERLLVISREVLREELESFAEQPLRKLLQQEFRWLEMDRLRRAARETHPMPPSSALIPRTPSLLRPGLEYPAPPCTQPVPLLLPGQAMSPEISAAQADDVASCSQWNVCPDPELTQLEGPELESPRSEMRRCTLVLHEENTNGPEEEMPEQLHSQPTNGTTIDADELGVPRTRTNRTNRTRIGEEDTDRIRDELIKLGLLDADNLRRRDSTGTVHRGRAAARRVYGKMEAYVEPQQGCPRLEALDKSTFFSSFCLALIMVNAYVMALAANHQIQNLDETEADVFERVEIVFVVLFSIEFGIHVGAQRLKFLCSGWGLYDIFIIICGYMDIYFSGAASGNLTMFRLLRATKLLKVLRVARIVNVVRELRLLVDSLIGSARALLWTILLILGTLFMFGVLQVNLVGVYLAWDEEYSADINKESLMDSWGSVATAMYTLFSCSTNGRDWREVADPLSRLGLQALIPFLAYVVIFYFALTNSVCAIFIEATSSIAAKDHSRLMQEQIAHKRKYMSALIQLFGDLENESGHVTKDGLLARLDDHRMVSFATTLGIDAMDLSHFFDILSMSGTRPLDLERFVEGCIRMRGQARSMDVVEISMHLKGILDTITIMQDKIYNVSPGQSRPAEHAYVPAPHVYNVPQVFAEPPYYMHDHVNGRQIGYQNGKQNGHQHGH